MNGRMARRIRREASKAIQRGRAIGQAELKHKLIHGRRWAVGLFLLAFFAIAGTVACLWFLSPAILMWVLQHG